MIDFDDIRRKIQKKHNAIWPQIRYHACRILISKGSLSGKANS